MSNKYCKVYEKIRTVTVESVGFPMNYNYLTSDQESFLEEVIEQTINLYKDHYVGLVSSLKEELEDLAEQAEVVLNGYE